MGVLSFNSTYKQQGHGMGAGTELHPTFYIPVTQMEKTPHM